MVSLDGVRAQNVGGLGGRLNTVAGFSRLDLTARLRDTYATCTGVQQLSIRPL